MIYTQKLWVGVMSLTEKKNTGRALYRAGASGHGARQRRRPRGGRAHPRCGRRVPRSIRSGIPPRGARKLAERGLNGPTREREHISAALCFEWGAAAAKPKCFGVCARSTILRRTLLSERPTRYHHRHVCDQCCMAHLLCAHHEAIFFRRTFDFRSPWISLETHVSTPCRDSCALHPSA